MKVLCELLCIFLVLALLMLCVNQYFPVKWSVDRFPEDSTVVADLYKSDGYWIVLGNTTNNSSFGIWLHDENGNAYTPNATHIATLQYWQDENWVIYADDIQPIIGGKIDITYYDDNHIAQVLTTKVPLHTRVYLPSFTDIDWQKFIDILLTAQSQMDTNIIAKGIAFINIQRLRANEVETQNLDGFPYDYYIDKLIGDDDDA